MYISHSLPTIEIHTCFIMAKYFIYIYIDSSTEYEEAVISALLHSVSFHWDGGMEHRPFLYVYPITPKRLLKYKGTVDSFTAKNNLLTPNRTSMISQNLFAQAPSFPGKSHARLS